MSAVRIHEACLFRPMSEADLDTVMDIERRAYSFGWTDGIFADCLRVGYCCWVLTQEEQVIGYGVMSVAAGEAHMLNVCVDPKRQRCGLGRHLMERMIELARAYGAGQMLLEVRPGNKAARALYATMGFSEVGRRKDYYPAAGGREDALILCLDLVDGVPPGTQMR